METKYLATQHSTYLENWLAALWPIAYKIEIVIYGCNYRMQNTLRSNYCS